MRFRYPAAGVAYAYPYNAFYGIKKCRHRYMPALGHGLNGILQYMGECLAEQFPVARKHRNVGAEISGNSDILRLEFVVERAQARLKQVAHGKRFYAHLGYTREAQEFLD